MSVSELRLRLDGLGSVPRDAVGLGLERFIQLPVCLRGHPLYAILPA